MPITLEARRTGQSIVYGPQDFRAYSLAVSARGFFPPAKPLQIRLPSEEEDSPRQLEAIEPEIAAFFGLGSVSGIDYVIARQ